MLAKHILAVGVVLTVLVLVLAACRSLPAFPHADAQLGPAWEAWRRGDVLRAQVEAERLANEQESEIAGHFMLALIAHVQGEHPRAISHFQRVDLAYRWYRLLVEPMLWSYVFADRHESAVAHAERHRLGQATIDRIRLDETRPLAVAISGVVELPFTQDELSVYMPGFEGTVNGREVVARLDTGGAFLHVSADAAEQLGIETIGCDTGFAALSRTRICYGVADLELGPVKLTNVPVAVHDQGLSAAPLAEHFGSPMDAIIGTNILGRFLATVDGPNARMILSARGDTTAAGEHRRLVGGGGTEVPFGIWTDHLMIAQGEIADRGPLSFFVDSGLVMATPDQGQASLLMSKRTLGTLGVQAAGEKAFTPIPGKSGLTGAGCYDLLAYPVTARIWKGYGDWGGMDVAALIGWGYLKRFCWTIDFDRRVYTLRPSTQVR